MSVDLQPQELGFRRPFNHEITENLKLTNSNDAPVVFKVKTTAPKQYCVRPNSGIIKPNSSVEVQVLLQAMREEPPLDAKCRDKFLVQSVLTTPEEEANVAAIWSNIEKTAKSSIQERKIRVNFLLPSSSATNGVAAVTTGTTPAQHDDEPPAYSSPVQFGSPATRSTPSTKPAADIKSITATASEAATGVAATVSGAATSGYTSVTKAVPTSTEELQQKPAAPKAQISKLTSQLSDPQLRQRKVHEAREKMQTVVQQSQETGVPLHIVAGLCLLSFLIGYLFF